MSVFVEGKGWRAQRPSDFTYAALDAKHALARRNKWIGAAKLAWKYGGPVVAAAGKYLSGRKRKFVPSTKNRPSLKRKKVNPMHRSRANVAPNHPGAMGRNYRKKGYHGKRKFNKKKKRKRASLGRQLEKALAAPLLARNAHIYSRVVHKIFPDTRRIILKCRETLLITVQAQVMDKTDYRMFTFTPNDINQPFGAESNRQGNGLDELVNIYQNGYCYKYKVAVRMRNNDSSATDDTIMFLQTNHTQDESEIIANTDQLKACRIPYAKMARSTEEVVTAPSRWMNLFISPRNTMNINDDTDPTNASCALAFQQALNSTAGQFPPARLSYVNGLGFTDEQASNAAKLTPGNTFLVDVVITQWCFLSKRNNMLDNDT